MNDLQRELAPVSEAAWTEIENEARSTLRDMLAARKLIDFRGPLSWEVSAVDEGRADKLATPGTGIEARLRRVQPLVELRVPFSLKREELEAVARGANDPDLDPVRDAARLAALAEDRAVFHGYEAAGIRGIAQTASGGALKLSDDFEQYPAVVADALGPRCYTGLTKTTQGGYPVIEHVRRLLDGPIVWAPGIDGAAVLSLRGGDFELSVGQDFSIGYLEHSATQVHLYLQESFTFRVLSPEAGVPLAYAKR